MSRPVDEYGVPRCPKLEALEELTGFAVCREGRWWAIRPADSGLVLARRRHRKGARKYLEYWATHKLAEAQALSAECWGD